MNKILVIDDEQDMRETISEFLTMNDYEVVLAENGDEGIEKAKAFNPGIIICDVNMPKKNGFEVLEEIRKSKELQSTQFIFLTYKSDREHFRKGMNLSADDYLTKPFAIEELLARTRALLRRAGGAPTGILQVDDVVLNPVTREVTRGGQRLEFTTKEYALLEYLMRNAGRVLTRSMITEHVWDLDFDTFTNVIDVYISYLRNKIDKGRERSLIQTVRGSGYMMRSDG